MLDTIVCDNYKFAQSLHPDGQRKKAVWYSPNELASWNAEGGGSCTNELADE
jgi:hypothetical protein